MSGILDDARNAVGARVDGLRAELDERLAKLGGALTSMMVAMGVLIVLAAVGGAAIAASLVAIGVPLWIALWAVTLLAAACAVLAVRRARVKPVEPAVT